MLEFLSSITVFLAQVTFKIFSLTPYTFYFLDTSIKA